jgi:hypothetical protein
MTTNKVMQIPDELADSKEYAKLVKQMGEENAREFFQKSEADLRAVMAECEVQEKEAKNQMAANPDFAEAKGIVKDFQGSLNDALKPLRLKKQAAATVVAYRKSIKTATPAPVAE